MATKVASLYAEIGADTTKLNKGLKDSDAALKKSGQAMGSLASSAKNLAVGLGAAFTVGAVVNFSKEAVKAASDLNETVNKTRVVFGSSSKAIEDFADTAATALGQSKKEAMDAASTFATFGKAAGLTGNELVGFSTDLTGLASDLASFWNTSPEEAITSLGAALRGESEPIRKYGVLLNEATLKNKAMEMGIIDSTNNALTPQQRVLAAYQVILDQTGDAQGDFARTSDGLANQMRILEKQMENLKATLGEGLLPIINKVVTGLNSAASAAMLLATWSGKVNDAQEETSRRLMDSTDSYKEYAAAVIQANLAAGLISEGQAKIWTSMVQAGKSTDNFNDKIHLLGKAEYDAAMWGKFYVKSVDEIKKVTDAQTTAVNKTGIAYERSLVHAKNFNAVNKEAVRTAEEYGEMLARNEEKLANIEDLIGGRLGPEMEDFKKTQADLTTQLKDAQQEYDELIRKGYSQTSDKVVEVKDKIDELTGKIKENADAHDEATKRILFDLLAQRAAVNGLTDDEITFITTIAEKWGLIDEATAEAMQNADDALKGLANGEGINSLIDQFETASGLVRDIYGNLMTINGKTFTAYFKIIQEGQVNNPTVQGSQFTPSSTSSTGTTTTTTTTTTNRDTSLTGRHAAGADFIVPQRYTNDTFPVGYATAGERVTITPANQQSIGGDLNTRAIINAINNSKIDEARLVRLLRDANRKDYQ